MLQCTSTKLWLHLYALAYLLFCLAHFCWKHQLTFTALCCGSAFGCFCIFGAKRLWYILVVTALCNGFYRLLLQYVNTWVLRAGYWVLSIEVSTWTQYVGHRIQLASVDTCVTLEGVGLSTSSGENIPTQTTLLWKSGCSFWNNNMQKRKYICCFCVGSFRDKTIVCKIQKRTRFPWLGRKLCQNWNTTSQVFGELSWGLCCEDCREALPANLACGVLSISTKNWLIDQCHGNKAHHTHHEPETCPGFLYWPGRQALLPCERLYSCLPLLILSCVVLQHLPWWYYKTISWWDLKWLQGGGQVYLLKFILSVKISK